MNMIHKHRTKLIIAAALGDMFVITVTIWAIWSICI